VGAGDLGGGLEGEVLEVGGGDGPAAVAQATRAAGAGAGEVLAAGAAGRGLDGW
jgi:hypothetical protein